MSVVQTTGCVDRARFIGNLILGHPFEGIEMPSTMATVVASLTGDEHLGRDVDVGPGSLASNLDSIREGGGRSMGPARSTV